MENKENDKRKGATQNNVDNYNPIANNAEKDTDKKIDTNDAMYTTSKPITKDSKIYTISANLYPIEVTNRCTLPTT